MTQHALDVPARSPRLDDPDGAADALAPARCVGCDHAPPANGYLCGRCECAIPTLLAAIRDGFARLDATPHGSGAGLDTARLGAPTYGPRDGARVDVLALTTPPAGALARLAPVDVDEREPGPVTSHRAPERPRPELVPTVVALGRVADRCRAEGLLSPLSGPRTVAGESLRLDAPGVVEELPYRWWVGEALVELRAAAGAIRAALDEVEPSVPLGRCTRKVLGDPQLRELDGRVRIVRAVDVCEGLVRTRDGGRGAVCSSDGGHRWHGAVSVRALAGQLDEVHLDAASLSTHLAGLGLGEVPVERLRKWALDDEWPRRRAGRRTLYRLGSVLVSAQRRQRTRERLAPGAEPVQGAEGVA